MPSGARTSRLQGPSAITTSPASTGPDSRLDPPGAVGTMQRARVAGQRKAAQRGKTRGIGARQRQRIIHAHGTGPMHGVAKYPTQRRFERERAVTVERHIGDAEASGELEFHRLGREQAVRPIKLEPAAPAEMALRTRLGGERVVLGNGARQERPQHLSGLDQAGRLRGRPKGDKPRRDVRQKGEMIVGERGTLQCNAHKLGKARRKGGRKNGIAFDDAGIAVRRALARAAAIDQCHGQTALGEVECDRGADDTGSKHDDVAARQEDLRCGCPLSKEPAAFAQHSIPKAHLGSRGTRRMLARRLPAIGASERHAGPRRAGSRQDFIARRFLPSMPTSGGRTDGNFKDTERE